MRPVVVTLLVVASACGKSKCEKYAAHITEVMTRGLSGTELTSRSEMERSSARTACKAGEVDAKEQACVLAANDAAGVLTCALPPLPKKVPKNEPQQQPEPKPGGPLPAIARDWEERCNGGEAKACYWLALGFEYGGLGAADRKRQTVLFGKACSPKREITFGCLHTAEPAPSVVAAMCGSGRWDACEVLLDGAGAAVALKRDAALRSTFERACDAGMVAMCEAMPDYRGPATPTPLKKTELERLPHGASAVARRAAALCDRQIPAGCVDLADIYIDRRRAAKNGMRPNDARARELGQRGCTEAAGYGCRLVAEIALDTSGRFDAAIERDLRRSCDAGNISGCAGLAAGLEATGKFAEAAAIALELCASADHRPSCELGKAVVRK